MKKYPIKLKAGDKIRIGDEITGTVKSIGVPFFRDGTVSVTLAEIPYNLSIPEHHEVEVLD